MASMISAERICENVTITKKGITLFIPYMDGNASFSLMKIQLNTIQ